MITDDGARRPADPASDGHARGASARIRRLTQAALNVDATLDQVGTVADDLGVSLDEFRDVLGRMDAMLEKFGGSLDDFAGTVAELNSVVHPLTADREAAAVLATRIQRLVETIDWVCTPLRWAQAATGGVYGALRDLGLRRPETARRGGDVSGE